MPSILEKLGQILVRKGVLTQEQLDDCLRAHTKSVDGGKPKTLSEIIVSKGYSHKNRLSETLRAVGVLKFTCVKCRKRYSVDAPRLDAAYTCQRCGGPLEAEDIVPSHGQESSKPAPARPPPEVVEAAKDPKRRIGKYTLVHELGRGGYAVVYKAWDELLFQYVALKLIRTQDLGIDGAAAKDADVQEFLREARTAVKLSHPNIVRIYELGCRDDRHFLAMELVDGPSLAEMLKEERSATRDLPFYTQPTKYLRILRDVALALDYAHRQSPPIVHRDVKPQNILIDPSGRACIVDFGLAKELRPGAGATLTLSGITKGTPCYMSPEQALGKGPAVDARTDVYALGAIFYELLTGQPPFMAPTSREILNKVVSEEPAQPSAVLRSRGSSRAIVPDLEFVCLRALEKEKERRYPTAGAFAAELDRFMKGDAVQARPVTAVERAWRWAKRRPAVVLSTSAAIVMAVVAAVALTRGGKPPEKIVERVVEKDEAETRRRDALREIDAFALEMKFDRAAKACDKLLAEPGEKNQKDMLRHRRDEYRLQADLIKGLAVKVRAAPRDFESFGLADGTVLESSSLMDATLDGLIVRYRGSIRQVAWSGILARQFLDLMKYYWPDMEGRDSLALGLWCLRHGLTQEAATLFNRPDAKRYQEELGKTEKSKEKEEEESVSRLFEQAYDALARKDYVVARARFERILTLRPNDEGVAKELERIAKLEKAAAAPDPPVAKEPERAPEPEPSPKPPPAPDPAAEVERLMKQARERAKQGYADAAIADYTEVLRLDPKFAEAQYLRGFIRHYERREYTLAIEDFTRALELEPTRYRAVFMRGLSHYNLGAWAKAVADFRAAMDLNAGNGQVYQVDLWLARIHLGERQDATRELRAANAKRYGEGLDAEWWRIIGGYLTDDVNEQVLLKTAEIPGEHSTPEQRRCQAYFMIGTKCLALGNKNGALSNFGKVLDTGVTGLNVDLAARAELERLGGAPVPAPEPPKDPPAAKLKAQDAITKGILFLTNNNASFMQRFDYAKRTIQYTELVLWTYLQAGVKENDPAVQALLKEMLERKLEFTACAALQAMILEELDRVKYQKRIWQCAVFLLDNQGTDGSWSYGSPSIYGEDPPTPVAGPGPKPAESKSAAGRVKPAVKTRLRAEKNRDGESGDTVNSFFAAMGLRACQDAGIILPRGVLDKANACCAQWQKPMEGATILLKPKDPRSAADPRGWCYRGHGDHKGYGSTTAATTAALAIWDYLVDSEGGKKLLWKKDPRVTSGVAWLTSNYSVTGNPGPYELGNFEVNSNSQYFFYLFALGQALTLLGVEDLGGHDWHSEGAKGILERQKADGSWSFDAPGGLAQRYGTSGLCDHCFAILFLQRAVQPLPDPTAKPKK